MIIHFRNVTLLGKWLTKLSWQKFFDFGISGKWLWFSKILNSNCDTGIFMDLVTEFWRVVFPSKFPIKPAGNKPVKCFIQGQWIICSCHVSCLSFYWFLDSSRASQLLWQKWQFIVSDQVWVIVYRIGSLHMHIFLCI